MSRPGTLDAIEAIDRALAEPETAGIAIIEALAIAHAVHRHIAELRDVLGMRTLGPDPIAGVIVDVGDLGAVLAVVDRFADALYEDQTGPGFAAFARLSAAIA